MYRLCWIYIIDVIVTGLHVLLICTLGFQIYSNNTVLAVYFSVHVCLAAINKLHIFKTGRLQKIAQSNRFV